MTVSLKISVEQKKALKISRIVSCLEYWTIIKHRLHKIPLLVLRDQL